MSAEMFELKASEEAVKALNEFKAYAASTLLTLDLIGTFVLLLVTTGLALWLAGKIFRVGILRTGQPPRILEMLAWVRRKD